MLDIHYFREHFEEVKKRLATKHFTCDLESIRTLDEITLKYLQLYEGLYSRQKILSQWFLPCLGKENEPITYKTQQAIRFAQRQHLNHPEILTETIQLIKHFPENIKKDLSETAKYIVLQGKEVPNTSVFNAWQKSINLAQGTIAQLDQLKTLLEDDKKEKEILEQSRVALKAIKYYIIAIENSFKLSKERTTLYFLTIPNLPDLSVPIGKTSQENKELSQWHPNNEDFSQSVPHYDLPGFANGIDFERGSKTMGAGFPFYVGSMARLVRALVAFFLEEARKNGYTELHPPLLVNADSATATGQLPDKEGQMYVARRIDQDDKDQPIKYTNEGYLIPTAEVPITNFFRNEILSEADLPKKYCAYSPCFRREAGSWGKDVRGLNRLHQFDKVELVQWVKPEAAKDALHSLLKEVEKLLQLLELPYRVMEICTGDLGFPHAKQYDLEVWAAGQQRWLEVSSCSWFTDFQARRANIRFREKNGSLRFVHTLNGSGLAVPRVLAAILENNHLGNGRIHVPPVLQTWLPKEEQEAIDLQKIDKKNP